MAERALHSPGKRGRRTEFPRSTSPHIIHTTQRWGGGGRKGGKTKREGGGWQGVSLDTTRMPTAPHTKSECPETKTFVRVGEAAARGRRTSEAEPSQPKAPQPHFPCLPAHPAHTTKTKSRAVSGRRAAGGSGAYACGLTGKAGWSSTLTCQRGSSSPGSRQQSQRIQNASTAAMPMR